VRVLLVGNHWTAGPGGAETVLVLTADLLRAAGHEVLPLALAEDATLPTPLADLLPRSAKDAARTAVGEAWGGVWSRAAARAVQAAVRRARPDVAHVHHVHEGLTLAVLHALHRLGVPVVMTLHDYRVVCPGFRLWADGQPSTRCLAGGCSTVLRHRCLEGSRWRAVAASGEAWVARRLHWYDDVAVFLAPSRFLRDRVVEGGLPADRVRVLANPVRLSVGLPVRTGRPADPPVVAYTGRLVAEKGLHVLLDAARWLPAGVRVRVTGSGRLSEELAARVRAERLPVDLLGAATPAGAADELARASVAVLPALWWENGPMAVLEAAAAGVPVVATAMGGIPESVRHDRTGLLVPAGDARALARALTLLLEDPARARALGEAGRALVRAHHDPGSHVAALQEAYRDAVERAASRSSP
jgi:glycosyltransferase involved in cell wall biosynthesis